MGKAGGRNLNLVYFCFAIVLWGLWTTRNKWAIEGIFPRHPSDFLFKINMMMQKWRILLRDGERTTLDGKIKRAEDWVEDFKKKCRERPPEEDFM